MDEPSGAIRTTSEDNSIPSSIFVKAEPDSVTAVSVPSARTESLILLIFGTTGPDPGGKEDAP